MSANSQQARILEFNSPAELTHVLREIRVDPYGIKIMLPKAESRLIRITGISNIAANIIKQEMLSFGGDAAVSKDALTGKCKKTDCLIIGDLSSVTSLVKKLRLQPFGLRFIAEQISQALASYRNREKLILKLGRYNLNLSKRAHIMGIVNITPDSFSRDGLLKSPLKDILEYAQCMVSKGADIIDVGGESSRPGAIAVTVGEELRRVIPVIKLLSKKISVPLSVDTYKPQVANAALDNGAVMVNDISGLRNDAMIKTVSRHKAAVTIMHMKGIPRTMQRNIKYGALINEVTGFLTGAIKKATDGGIEKERIVIDPGVGFGKELKHNLRILRNLAEFKSLGLPIMVGVSRKSFIGKISGKEATDRLYGSLAAEILALREGANLLRVHDVAETKDALDTFEAIRQGWN